MVVVLVASGVPVTLEVVRQVETTTFLALVQDAHVVEDVVVEPDEDDDVPPKNESVPKRSSSCNKAHGHDHEEGER